MHSVQTAMWDPRPPSKHASPLPPRPPSYSRPAHVTTPAKRITFYKSGDSQFGGVRMAIHKRSFKCFDALLDDLSQKVPLPFGVRTVTTPRGTHSIKHLEQLQDGGCYLCSDRRQAKPVNMELASKRPSIWQHHSRRPQRPDSSSATPPGHFAHRQRRILLVKNSEPGMRRSIVLGRRSTRSLRAFLDEVSEVMQFHVRKLYTAEGRRIDSVQSLITCPGVLVCVGREAFSPMLVNFIRKSSEEKLPGLGPRTPGNGARSPATQGARSPPHGAQSRASEYSEGHESKKNVNFGLETKKSIIHPRSDSSTRSARFSLSSEKSYGNGVSAYSQARPAIMNDDIEKRVLVNKDGSLSVEMRVRFRLHNDETLQWSTQVKKSPSLTNECCPLSQAQPCYLQQGQSESCSDPDSGSFDPEGAEYSSQPLHHVLGVNHCPCCFQRQEQQYDLWENPAHCHKQAPGPPPHATSHTVMRHTHSSSSSSSCNSRRVVRCRARVCNSGGGSDQSQLVQEEMFVSEQVEHRVEVEQGRDTHIEVSKVSRCCSRSEVVATDSSLHPLSRRSAEEEQMIEEEGERPPSAVSTSSHVLQSLKEDLDDELPPSASQCSHRSDLSPSAASQSHPSHVSIGSARRAEEGRGGSGAVSAASSCRCGVATPRSVAEEERAPSSKSKTSSAFSRSSRVKIPKSEEEGAADDEDEEIKRTVSVSGPSRLSGASSVCTKCGGCKRAVNSDSNSQASLRSNHSQHASPMPPTPLSSHEKSNNGSDHDGSDESGESTQSNKTNLTNHGRCSAISNVLEDRACSEVSNHEAAEKEEERAPSASSARSHRSHRSGRNGVAAQEEKERSPSATLAKSPHSNAAETRQEAEGENTGERAHSALSARSAASGKTRSKAASPAGDTAVQEEETNRTSPSVLSVKSCKVDRPASVLSAKSAKSTKSDMSAKSGTSHKSTCSRCAKAASPVAKEPEATEQEEEAKAETRAASATSAKSNLSAKSNKSNKSTKERSLSPRTATGGDGEERAASQASCRSGKSNKSKSAKSQDDGGEEAEKAVVEEEQQRAESATSAKSAKSRVASPAKAEDRTASAMSGKSHLSAKSAKSQKSNRTAASPSPDEADIPSPAQEEQKENEERSASAMSVKSDASVRSATSNKSSKNPKSVSPSPNVTIKTPEEVEEERAPSAASAKSGKSNVSAASSHKSNQSRKADEVEENALRSQSQMLSPRRKHTPKSSSPVQQLLPGESRGPSVLSVHSAKSGKSKCSCGAASARETAQRAKEELKSEEASERAASNLSSSSNRQRRESGGTEQPLSRNSSGSVSLGLPEDQETADSDSGKSSVSFSTNTDRKSRAKTATPGVPKSPKQEEKDEVASIASHKSQKSTPERPAVEIPTIETPGQSQDRGEEAAEEKPDRGASALSAKSSRSHRSSCNCRAKSAAQKLSSEPKEPQTSASPAEEGNDPETGSVKSASKASMSSASAKVRSKSPASANEAADSGDIQAKAEEEVHSNSPVCLRPESAVSARSNESKGKVSVPEHRAKSSCSTKTSRSQRKEVESASPCVLQRPCSKVETCSESTLSHSLSAADLLKENMAAARPSSCQSKTSKASKASEAKSRRSQRSRNHGEREEVQLSPACLPNASPSEVVSDWLRSIPANSTMLALGDELNQEEQEAAAEGQQEEEKAGDEEEEKAEAEKEEEAGCDAAEQKSPEPAAVVTAQPKLVSSDSLPRNLQSAVMKVLLSSSLGRCRSMPEVSPVYGRRLSTSARGLLDCLAQLQLIEPVGGPGSDQKKRYEDIMVILQSLWLTEPRDMEAKDASAEQVTPPRSSSGVGMSSGSGGSGKENGNPGGDEAKQNITEEASLEGAEKVGGDEEEQEEEGGAEADVDEADGEPGGDTVPPSLDSPKDAENPSSSDKGSPNESSKSPTDTLEDTSSGTPPTVLRAPLSKKPSQDPDPVWVLHLLKKLEKQFMDHYINAMAEFKVRWELDDSRILDTMIGELRDEVKHRIQSSVEREVRKIQSRAGRGGRSPRPPQRGNLSRDSTMTEKRRRILKVMKNQSVKTADSLSDGELTGDFSDQRSEDEYCPCDACVRKKMAARPLKTNPLAAEAPVMMEFDLLKILQLKKSPPPASALAPKPAEDEGESEVTEEMVGNLEVVQEEEEEDDETKEDIKAEVVLEETIPEEDEEKDEAGEKEEQEEGGGGEAGEEETPENAEEEEEEEEVRCQCHAAGDEEEEGEEEGEDAEETTGHNTGEEEEGEGGEEEETESGEEEKEETAEEATGGEGETTENDGGEEEECEVCELKEGTAGSGEEEEQEECGAVTNEESTLVEELREGNISASADAEDEDEAEEGTAEGEQGGESEEQAGEASEEEHASSKDQVVTVTEGEEADAEDSDTDGKQQSTSAEESGQDAAEEESGGEAVEEFKPEEDEEEKREDGALLHQITRTSVESQPGSLEDATTDSPQNPGNSIEVPKVASGGGMGQRRSRSPGSGRVNRRRPPESDVELP